MTQLASKTRNQLASPFIIDIEASGFGSESYPIEVGVALGDGSKYCSLISPTPGWTHWDPKAERIHRISRELLEQHGRPVRQVADKLNRLLTGKTLFSDGWVVDKPWLTTLYHAAGLEMQFTLSPLELILSESQMERWHETKERIIDEMKLARHRASYDAWVIQQTFKQTLELQ